MEIERLEFKPIQAFLSYSSKDKEIAGQVKENLEKYGIEAFLAHEDIEVSEDWKEVIIKKLEDCEIFIPIISNNFKESDWADQESGIAFYQKKIIAPIYIDKPPYGFIGKFQGEKLNSNVSMTCEKILETVKKYPVYDRIRDGFIAFFAKSAEYLEANERAQLIEGFEPYSEKQVKEIVSSFIDNPQITGAFVAQATMDDFVKKHSSQISPHLLRLYRRKRRAYT